MFRFWKHRIKRQLIGTAIAGLLAMSAGAASAAAQDGAVAFLDGLNKDVVAEVAAPDLGDSQRQRNFRTILQRVFSLDEICDLVLGRYGRAATASEREEFRRLFENMLVLTWTRRFRDYTGHGIRFGNAMAMEGGGLVVPSQLVETTNRQPVTVEWRLRGENGRYRLLDIKAEGVSMVLTYRSEYQTVLRNSGMAGLNGLLRKKIGEMGAPG